jgi:hypothetical protein
VPQVKPQVPLVQVALPFVGALQSAALQQALVAMQAPLQTL